MFAPCLLAAFALLPGSQRVAARAEPARGAETVTVLFRAREAGRDGEPVGGAHFVVGIAASKEPSPRFVDEPILASATSGEDGLVRAELPLPAGGDVQGLWLWARAETPGLVRNSSCFPLVEADEANPHRITMYEGATYFGAVRCQDGRPVPGATVRFVAVEGSEVTDDRWTRSDRAGRFAMSTRNVPGRYTVLARHEDEGTSVVPLGAPGESLDLELVPRAALAGRVVDHDGVPLDGLYLAVVPAGTRALPERELAALAELRGLRSPRVAKLDAEGRFALRSLAPGAYDLHACWSEPRGGHRLVGGRGVVPVAREVEARVMGERATEEPEFVARLYRVAVKLELEDEREPDIAEHLALCRLPVEGWRDRIHALRVEGRSALFSVGGPGRYAVGWIERGVELAEVLVDVEPHGAFHAVTLTLREAEPARLTVRAVTPDGEAYDRPSVRVFSAGSGLPLFPEGGEERAAALRDGASTAELPAGRYRVTADATDDWLVTPHFHVTCATGIDLPDPWPRNRWRGGETMAFLLAGEEGDTVVRLRPAGHLDFVAADGQATAPAPEELFGAGARERWGGGEAVLLDPKNSTLVAEVAVDLPGPESFPQDWIAPGWSARGITALPVGDWRLAVRDGETILFERPVRIAAGEVTRVVW